MKAGALPGREIALITFTNTGSSTCGIVGYPSVSLRLSGQPVGSPAQRTTKTPTLITLAPKAQAQSQITDIVACQAPLSDTARITAPGSKTSVDRPLRIRACSLYVDPVTKATN